MGNPYQYTGSGQGFLTDYSNLAGAGSAFESFAKSFGAAQEAAAQREALKTKMQREKEQSAIEAYKAGGEFKPDGSFGERTLSVRENEDRELKGLGEGYKPDPNRPGHFIVDTTSPAYIKAIKSGQATGERTGFNEHKAAVGAVADDKETKALLGGYQAIQNAVTNFKASGGMPQEFHQLQTALRLYAGSGQRTGVEERSKGYAHDWGISKDEAMQIMTGNIQDVALSSPQMVKAIEGISEAELDNKRQQAAQQIAKKAKMFRGVYDNPVAARFEPAFHDTVKSQYGQFGLDENGKLIPIPPQPQQQQQGLTKQRGILGQMAGMLGFGEAQAAPPAAKVKERNKLSDEEVRAEWLKLHPSQRSK